MMQTEVTQSLYETVMGENPSEFTWGANFPVEEVSWFDAVFFARALNDLEEREQCYEVTEGDDGELTVLWSDFECTGWRLPTEAEWEYAARGNEDFIYAGSDEVAWYQDNADYQSHEVGVKNPNAFGLYDMSGNVEEWCWDGYESNIYQTYADLGTVQDPSGAEISPDRVLRGGGWGLPSRFSRVSNRIFVSAESVRRIFGFRLVRTSDSN
jgi:formylglycine-generating enzyme required for sulfatase activity